MRKKHKQRRTASHQNRSEDDRSVRIIGGEFRRKSLIYDGHPGTRPMKNRTREAVFNLLGTIVEGKYAIDLFAGTGALGLEALSRGASKATFLERHVPTAKTLEQNVAMLGVEDRAEVIVTDAFFWARQVDDVGNRPLLVFCSPPYEFYEKRRDDMVNLLSQLLQLAPAKSCFVVEADDRFVMDQLPRAAEWEIRRYPPAVIAILRES
jgi:16S rRNA (guanine(966)-N(2))-methyltransferase RsmD